jgi:hypothetical protein
MIHVIPPVPLAPAQRWEKCPTDRLASGQVTPAQLAPLESYVMVEVVGSETVADVPNDPAFELRATLLGGRLQDGRWLFPASKLQWVRTLCEQLFGNRGDDNAPLIRCYEPNHHSGGSVLAEGGLVVAKINDEGVLELGAGMRLALGDLSVQGEGEKREIVAGEEGALIESMISVAYGTFLATRSVQAKPKNGSRRHSKSTTGPRHRKTKKRI